MDFLTLNLPAPLMAALEKMNFSTPTPIQAEAIPLGLAGRDILGSAQTGTGKTAAFSIPLVARIMENVANREAGTALILTPTRELATQVKAVIHQLLDLPVEASNSADDGPRFRRGYRGKKRNDAEAVNTPVSALPPIRTALLIGGDSMSKQLRQLKDAPRIIVGTPGRVNDHLERGTLDLSHNHILVLDETDRMLDMGFGIQLDQIIRHLPDERQTMMFSATLPRQIVRLADKYQHQPVRISVGDQNAPATRVKQEVLYVNEGEKYNTLIQQIEQRQGTIIIFVKTKFGAEKLAARLSQHGHSADAIHGNLAQRQRDRVIAAFRSQSYRIMVATDIAARGLDIPHIEHVINHDLPQCPEDYIHRIGRTARAGAEGSAISLISPDDNSKWRAISRLLKPEQAGGKITANSMPARNVRPASSGKTSTKPHHERVQERSFRGGSQRRDTRFDAPTSGERPMQRKAEGGQALRQPWDEAEYQPETRRRPAGAPARGDRPQSERNHGGGERGERRFDGFNKERSNRFQERGDSGFSERAERGSSERSFERGPSERSFGKKSFAGEGANAGRSSSGNAWEKGPRRSDSPVKSGGGSSRFQDKNGAGRSRDGYRSENAGNGGFKRRSRAGE
ncbi:MAG: DEAD/DEAH box helicase [Alphaproteobacteria bacterium]